MLTPETTSAPAPPLSLRQRFRAAMHRIAAGRSAVAAMCLLSFTDACCSPVLPEVLLVPMCLMHRERQYRYAFYCALASVLGGIAGYLLGAYLWEHGLREFTFAHVPGFTPEWYERVAAWYGGHTFLWVWLAGFTPLPYKVFTVFAGVCHDQVDFTVFVLASITSRFPRIYGTVWLLDRFGQSMLDFLVRQFSRIVLVTLAIALVLIWWQRMR